MKLATLYKKAINKGMKLVTRARARIFPPLRQDVLFPTAVILHFSQHKCLTEYYRRIMLGLGDEFGFTYTPFTSDLSRFSNAALNGSGKRVLSLNNRSDIPFDLFPPYRGSRFIRDPRDLILSGFYYHLQCKEAWCITPAFNWSTITAEPGFALWIESNPSRHPRNISYQEYQRQLEPEKGIILEMLWRREMMQEMGRWKPNEQILQLRYEEIIGNEPEVFNKVFEHYQFHARLISRGVELADRYSLRNARKYGIAHVRSGSTRQWASQFSTAHKAIFKELTGNLLTTLGYEEDSSW